MLMLQPEYMKRLGIAPGTKERGALEYQAHDRHSRAAHARVVTFPPRAKCGRRAIMTPFSLAECSYYRTRVIGMLRRTPAILALSGLLACASGSTEAVTIAPGPEAFAADGAPSSLDLTFVRER